MFSVDRTKYDPILEQNHKIQEEERWDRGREAWRIQASSTVRTIFTRTRFVCQ